MDGLKASIDDLDEDEAKKLQKNSKQRHGIFFKVVITLIFGAIAITQIVEI